MPVPTVRSTADLGIHKRAATSLAGIEGSRNGLSHDFPWSAVRSVKEAANAYYIGLRGRPKLLVVPRE